LSDTVQPTVSVIIPMYQERDHILPCVEGFLAQSYPADRLEVLVVDGGSTDGSRELVEALAAASPRVRLIENPRRLAAAAANEGIAAAKGDVLCFLSAHGVPASTYVETSVAVLLETGAAGVGGRYEHVGTDAPSRAIGLAMASPFGMASPHRTASSRREVDTISHPTFWARNYSVVGGYDETLRANEDYELNARVRRLVGPLVFDPAISSVYRPRGSLRGLAKQFYAYGFGKAEFIRREPGSVRPRHLVPPATVLFLLSAPLLARHRFGAKLVIAALSAYGSVVAVATLRDRPWRHGASTAVFVGALPTMHATWGAGLLRGLMRTTRRRG
jgi:glycosyltransferase involved in cell wall biosynthesis